MSNDLRDLVWRIDFPNPAAKLIALRLADHAWDDGTHVFPGTPSIAKAANLSRSVVCKWLFALEYSGVLEVVERSKGGSSSGKKKRETYGNTTKRSLDVERLRGLASQPQKRPKPDIPSLLVLHESFIERPAINKKNGTQKTNADGSPRTVKVPVFVVQPRSWDSGRETDTPTKVEVSTSRTSSVRDADGECPPGGHKPLDEPSEGILHSPPTPRRKRRGARERDEIFDVLEDLNRKDGYELVVEKLVRPVLNKLVFEAPDPKAALIEIIEWAKRCSAQVLENAAVSLVRSRQSKVFPYNITDAVRQAAELAGQKIVGSLPGVKQNLGGVGISETKTPQQWSTWLKWHRAERQAGKPNSAALMEAHGFLIAPTAWPPTTEEEAA